ncbi:hypothetical protein LTR74_018684 [Friedmanniomyces endolithicus]|nr:hypothetical protein LTR74_018684 [Friedmanniomyces endolithicus]
MAKLDITIPPKPLVREIAAYNDEELDRYLEENGRDKVHWSRKATRSCAVDLDQVASRLRAASTHTQLAPRSRTPSPTPPLPSQEEEDTERLRRETASYPLLVQAGCRPPYPFDLLESFFFNPEQYLNHPEYHDIIMFWRYRILDEKERTLLCACHLLRWNRFCRLQHIIREQSLENEWTLIDAAESDSWEEYVECFGPKEGEWRFSRYAERIKKRLAKYGFSRPFQLESDLSRQDALTTWIEYLGYEYWFYDQSAIYVKRCQRKHDEAWKKLVDSGVLRPGESYDLVCDIEFVFKRAAENEEAKRAVQSTTAALLAAEAAVIKSRASQDVRDADERQLSAVQAACDRAEADYQLLVRRRDAITDFCQQTKGYRNANDDAERHLFLLRWIKQQIPLIECESRSVGSCIVHTERELNSKSLKVIVADDLEDLQHPDADFPAVGGSVTTAVERAPADSAGGRQGKRKRSRCETIDVHQRFKRSRITSQGDLETCLSNRTADVTRSARDAVEGTMNIGGREGGPEDGKANWYQHSQLDRPLRRSARIAQLATKAATLARSPAPLPVIRSKKRVTRLPVKVAKGSGLREMGEHTAARAARMSAQISRGDSTRAKLRLRATRYSARFSKSPM